MKLCLNFEQKLPPFLKTEEELNNIASRIMSNQEEVKRLSEQLNSSKLLDFFKENAKLKIKEVSYDKFIKEAYA